MQSANSSTPYPRVLFVTPAAFNRISGGGITFTNLFQGWPKDALSCVHDDPIPTTDEVCQRYWQLGPDEIRAWGPLQRLRGSVVRASMANGDATVVAPPTLTRQLLQAAKQKVFGTSMPEVGRLSPGLEAWIAAFRPQMLYTILGGNGMMELVEAIRVRFDLPLVVHFMDDWVEAHHRKGWLAFIERRRMLRLVDHATRQAARCLAIGSSMAEAYQTRYGRPFEAFQNTIDVARWSAAAKADPAPTGRLHLLYTGSILPFAQADSLAECCRVIAELADDGMEIFLDIHAPDFLVEPLRNRLCVSDVIRIRPSITDDTEYFAALAAADGLLLPVNFDSASVAFIRYSMPTKVPSYLVAGTPVLVYGPAQVAQVDYARRAGWGLVLDRRDPEGLKAALHRLAEDGELRRQLWLNARQVAAERHDAAVVRRRFQAMLAQVAKGDV